MESGRSFHGVDDTSEFGGIDVFVSKSSESVCSLETAAFKAGCRNRGNLFQKRGSIAKRSHWDRRLVRQVIVFFGVFAVLKSFFHVTGVFACVSLTDFFVI